MQTNQLTFERSIHAPVSQLFRAFTRSAALREWLCDAATTEPRPGGRIYLWWERGYYASGEFLKVETDQEISFKWQGRNEPGPTEVRITLSQNGDVTNLQLVHSGLGSGEVWDKAAEEFRKGWENGLENLVHTLEQGPDLRITTRPMMGIGLDDFNESIAKEIGVPVIKGVRISNAIEGMGAQAAGLRNNDVVVGLSGFDVTDFASLSAAMHGRKAGELVQMTFYRGPEKMTVTMTLSHRPIPVIPPTAAELADAVRAILTQCETQLDEFFTGITDEEAGHKISENEWSAKGILAHLIHSERGWQNALDEIVTDSEPSYDHFGGNNNARIEATLSVYPSLTDLLAELKRLYAETIACIANMPPEFVARKPAYWRVGFQALQLKSHFDIHLEQMQSIIKPVR